ETVDEHRNDNHGVVHAHGQTNHDRQHWGHFSHGVREHSGELYAEQANAHADNSRNQWHACCDHGTKGNEQDDASDDETDDLRGHIQAFTHGGESITEYFAVKSPSSKLLTSSVIASRSSAGMSVTPSASKVTVMVPVRSSSDRGDSAWMLASICSCGMPWAAICSPSGCAMSSDAITGLTMASWSAKSPVSFSSSSKASTSAMTCASVSVLPSGAWMTMVPDGSDM